MIFLNFSIMVSIWGWLLKLIVGHQFGRRIQSYVLFMNNESQKIINFNVAVLKKFARGYFFYEIVLSLWY